MEGGGHGWCGRAHDFLPPVLEGVSVVAVVCSGVLHCLSFRTRCGEGCSLCRFSLCWRPHRLLADCVSSQVLAMVSGC